MFVDGYKRMTAIDLTKDAGDCRLVGDWKDLFSLLLGKIVEED